MKQFGIASVMNDIGFVVTINDESRYEEAVELAWEGFRRWNDPDAYPEYYGCGCDEPAIELLDAVGIEHTTDYLYDEYGDEKEEYADVEIANFVYTRPEYDEDNE